MTFRSEIVDEEWYKQVKDYAFRTINAVSKNSITYPDNDDLFSNFVEKTLISNPVIEDKERFKLGYVRNAMKWAVLGHKFPLLVKSFKQFENIAEEEYDSAYDVSKTLENREKKLGKLKSLYQDRYYNSLTIKELSKKYKLTNRQIEWKLQKIVKILRMQEKDYKGIAKIDQEGNLVKVYHCIQEVIDDGYTRTTVQKLCNGKIKGKHKEFNWSYISNFTPKTTKLI